ncbi:MAG TPA: hypothetical protein VMZ03_06890 [Chitinophagaceae bacterium]|nr:hypothetical protein [Chitinophagaceae bacterium]
MDNSTPDILIQYLDGELPGNEQQDLQQKLEQDAGMQQQLDTLRSATDVIRFYGLKQKIAGLHVEMMDELLPGVKKMHPISPGRKLIRYSIAVAASLLLLFGAFKLFNPKGSSPDKIFASRYVTYELVTMRDGNGMETKVEKAYRSKNYTEVLRIHDMNEDHTPLGEFLCGAAALETKDLPKAIKCFNEVLDAHRQTGEGIMKDEAEYYLSLSYIRNQEYERALLLLNTIGNDPAHKYNDKVDDKLIHEVERLQEK